MGRRFSDASVQANMKLLPFEIMSGRGDKPIVAANYKCKKKLLAAEEIASMLLSKMKGDAEAYLGAPVTNAVVTVPASFDILQRCATKDACVIAGLNVLGIVHEPVAAAVAYGLHESTVPKNVLVFDVGGGTTSVALLAIAAGRISVTATAGDPNVGGEDFGSRMVEHLVARFKTEYKKVRLRAACEHAKRTLSSRDWAPIEIDSLIEGVDFRTAITRDQFEDLNMDLFDRCMQPVKKCLGDAEIERSDVHEVVLVGGSTRIPRVRRMLSDLFDGRELRQDINLEEAVACGAAIIADIASRVPDSNLLELFLLDTTPRSLGVEAAGGAMDVIIPKNISIPITRKQTIPIQSHNKRSVVLSVFEGENVIARDNSLLGELMLPGGDGAPPGAKRHIAVCFDIDVDGVLTVYAMDKTTKRKQKMKFMDKGQLSKEEIERMTKEATEYMAEDAENRERIKAKNLLEEHLYQKRRAIKVERNKADDALSAVELKIQQVHNDQLSSARKFLDDLEALKLECSAVAGKQLQTTTTASPLPRRCLLPLPLPLPRPHRPPLLCRLHSFSFPTLSWGTHRLLRCAKNPASSSPPPAAPETPSPDKENARPPVPADAAAAAPQRPWNLRTRRSATAAPRAFGAPDDDGAPVPPARHPEPSSDTRRGGFSVLLSKEEIADDFALFRGTRPPRRPKKRPRTVQRQIDSLCPGFCLADVTPETYKIEER